MTRGNEGCQTNVPVYFLNDFSRASRQAFVHAVVTHRPGDMAGGSISVAGFSGAVLAKWS